MKSHLIPALVLLAVCSAGAADAQTTSRRPYKALFGGAATDPARRHALDFTFSLAEAYDDNVLAESGGLGVGSGTGAQVGGFYTSLDPGVSYWWNRKTVQISATAGSSLRYYEREQSFLSSTHFGAVGIAAGSQSTRIALNQSVSYSPAYFYGLFPSLAGSADLGLAVGGDSDLAVNTNAIIVYDSSARFTQRFSPKSSFVAIGTFRHSDLSRVGADRSLQSYTAGGSYLYDLSRSATVHMGYVHREGRYSFGGDEPVIVAHDIDVGIDYHKPLSFSRRTRVDFGIGSTLVRSPAVDQTTNQTTDQLQYRMVGNAGLTHDMGRTWRARVVYNRGVGFIEAVRQPIFSDAVNASLEGFFSRRVDLHVASAFSIGDAGFQIPAQSSIRTYTASARLRRALTETWALFGEYIYYNYDLGTGVIVAAGIPRSINRNTARVGVTAWLPLVRK